MSLATPTKTATAARPPLLPPIRPQSAAVKTAEKGVSAKDTMSQYRPPEMVHFVPITGAPLHLTILSPPSGSPMSISTPPSGSPPLSGSPMEVSKSPSLPVLPSLEDVKVDQLVNVFACQLLKDEGLSKDEIRALVRLADRTGRVDEPTCIDDKTHQVARKILVGPKGEKIILTNTFINKGSNKEIFAGVGIDNARVYAVSIYDISKRQTDPLFPVYRRNLQREIFCAHNLRGERFVKTHFVVQLHPLCSYFVMDYYAGGTGFERVNEFITKVFPPIGDLRKRCETALGFMTAVRDLHQLGYIHRDLKAENFFIDRGIIFLGDFEFAAHHVKDDRGVQCGSPHYAAPELVTSKEGRELNDRISFSVDVWALGVLIFPLLAQNQLLPWFHRSGGEAIGMIGGLKDGPHLTFPSTTPREFVDLLVGMLEVDPKKRWSLDKAISHLENALSEL